MNQLRKEGTAIVYISHKLAEIRRICDRYTVMKDGSSVCSGMVSDVSNDDIVRLIDGRARITKSLFLPSNAFTFSLTFMAGSLRPVYGHFTFTALGEVSAGCRGALRLLLAKRLH